MNKSYLFYLSSLLGGVLMMALLFVGCSKRKTEQIDLGMSKDSLYSILTTDVRTLVSDSGVTQYRMVAPKWYIYDRKDPPYWYFPEGFYAEKFDENNKTVAYIKSDTAHYNTRDEIWSLLGNVRIINLSGEQFLAPRLYWDRRKGLIYSKDTVFIKSGDRVLRGRDFESNEDFTEYSFHNNSGRTTFEDEEL